MRAFRWGLPEAAAFGQGARSGRGPPRLAFRCGLQGAPTLLSRVSRSRVSSLEVVLGGGMDGSVRAWQLELAALERVGQPVGAHQGWVRALHYDVDNEVLVSCGDDGHVKVVGGNDPVQLYMQQRLFFCSERIATAGLEASGRGFGRNGHGAACPSGRCARRLGQRTARSQAKRSVSVC